MKCYVMHMDTQSPQTEKMPKNAMNIIKLLKKRMARTPDTCFGYGHTGITFQLFQLSNCSYLVYT